jgi:hypothetical protein
MSRVSVASARLVRWAGVVVQEMFCEALDEIADALEQSVAAL